MFIRVGTWRGGGDRETTWEATDSARGHDERGARNESAMLDAREWRNGEYAEVMHTLFKKYFVSLLNRLSIILTLSYFYILILI